MIFVAILFLVIGALVKHAKMYFLIAGYNTMSPEKQASINIAGIATLLRNVLWFMAVILIFGWVAEMILEKDIESFVITCTVVPGMIYLLIKSNSGKYNLPPKK